MKKKLFLIATFMITLVLVLVNINGKKVQAETQNCSTKTYYYMFLDSSRRSGFDNNWDSEGKYDRGEIKKYFRMPEEGSVVVSHGDVGVSYDDSAMGFAPKSRMSLYYYWNLMYNYVTNKGYDDGNGNVFIKALPWSETEGEITTGSITMKGNGGDTFDSFKTLVPYDENTGSYLLTSNVTFPTVSIDSNNIPYSTTDVTIQGEVINAFVISIDRTWYKSEIDHIDADSIVWSPAVYYVEYEICEEETSEGACYLCDSTKSTYWGVDPSFGLNSCPSSWRIDSSIKEEEDCVYPSTETKEKYTVKVRYIDKDTGSTLAKDYTLVDEKVEGTTYSYDCSEKSIDNYALYKDDETKYPTSFNGTVTQDETLTCYYTKAKTYTLTVEHYEEGNTKDKLVTDFTKSGYPSGEKYSHQCQIIPGYTVVNSAEHPSTLSGQFSNSSVTRQCYYTRNKYLLTVNYGSDEDCSGTPLQNPDTYEIQYKDSKDIKIPKTIGDMSNPKLGTYDKNFKTNPTLNGTTLKVTMPAKNVSICIAYSPQTGASWIYLAWVIGVLALGYSIWYFVRYYKRQNGEV